MYIGKPHAGPDPVFIVTDECHRSIIGLTTTPSRHTLGFFNPNLVAEYPCERSVADGVNEGCKIYSIRTRVDEEGGEVEAGDVGF